MPNWNQLLVELTEESNLGPQDRVRRKYLKELSDFTGRNVIAYYSGWLQKPNQLSAIMGDNDVNGFMTTIHQLDRSKGLDLILHTPGGNIASVETIVTYLRKMFGLNIRAIIPQLAMSAGTMLSCACQEIVMGKHSSLGPIDPQFNGISAEAVKEEFEKAIQEVKRDPASLEIWKVIIGKYHPTFIGDCDKAIVWSKTIVTKWLQTGMFANDSDGAMKADKVVSELSSHKDTLSHGRQISMEECERVGLKLVKLEENDKLQDLVLTVHHAYMHTFSSTLATKIIENQSGQAMVLIQNLGK